MDEWKGKEVRITVYKKVSDRSWSSAVPSKDYILNADTMADVFNEYDPSSYTFTIEPATEDAWPKGLEPNRTSR